LRQTGGASRVSVTGPPRPEKRPREEDDTAAAPDPKRSRGLDEDTWADIDPNRRMTRPLGMPEDDGANSAQLREPFDGTPETLFALPSARTAEGRPACGICANSANEAVITNEIIRACSSGRGVEVAISSAIESYETYRKENMRYKTGIDMPQFPRSDFQYHAATCILHDAVQNAISLSTAAVFARALAGTASNGMQANGRQLAHHQTIKAWMDVQKLMADTRAAQKKASAEVAVATPRATLRPEDRQ